MVLNSLYNTYEAEKVVCSLYDNKLLISLKMTKDVFEIGDIKTPIQDTSSIYTFCKELNEIYKVSDFLIDNDENITIP